MPIYTRTGDRGTTSLGTGKRVYKDSKKVEAYGSIDELNSIIGVVCSQLEKKSYRRYLLNLLTEIQSDLFCLGSNLANPKMRQLLEHFPERITKFEQEIDFMMKKTGPLKNFILPQGGLVGSFLQLARTVSRRAERQIVSLSKKEKVDDKILIYINRLSDFFLAASRFANYHDKKKEIIWSREKYKK